MTGEMAAALDELSVWIPTGHKEPDVPVLQQVSLTLRQATVTALVGESGCGKSMVAAALTGLLPPGARTTGVVRIGGRDVAPRGREWRALRGRTVGLVPQSPATSFTPVRRLGAQLHEVVEVLGADRNIEQLCREVSLDTAALQRYPHQLSGGMAQRAALAAALAGRPQIIVADEPTSALDADLAAGVWRLLAAAAADGAAVLVITHDIDALRAADACDDVVLMRAGRIVRNDPTYADGFFAEVI